MLPARTRPALGAEGTRSPALPPPPPCGSAPRRARGRALPRCRFPSAPGVLALALTSPERHMSCLDLGNVPLPRCPIEAARLSPNARPPLSLGGGHGGRCFWGWIMFLLKFLMGLRSPQGLVPPGINNHWSPLRRVGVQLCVLTAASVI